jgi:putative two-component system response regulator
MQNGLIENSKILIIDDQKINVRLLEGILVQAGYKNIIASTESSEALPLFREHNPDLVLLDLHMPAPDGFTVMSQIKEIDSKNVVPVVVLTADAGQHVKQQALQGGAMDFLNKPFSSIEVLLRVRNLLQIRQSHLQLTNQNQILETMVQERTRKLEETQVEMLDRLAQAAECRDDDTGQHTNRVGNLAAHLGEKLGMSPRETWLLRRAAALHDVGKIAIPDSILLKPGKLTPEEFDVIKSHTIAGGRLLQVKMAETIAVTHHEKWNGHGYPVGLKGEDIPLEGRIVALADVFDALTNERPYKRAWTIEEAMAEIVEQSEQHFDPRVVDAFLVLLAQGWANPVAF